MAAETEGLLRAEESVNKLLDRLEKLKRNVEGYSKAKGSLEDASSHLVSFTKALSETTEQLNSVVSALKEVRTHEILKEIATVAALHEETATAVQTLQQDLTAAIQNSESQLKNELDRSISSLKSATSAIQEDLREHSDKQCSKIARDVATLRHRINSQSNVLWLIVVLAVASILLLLRL